ncbi:MAG: caspase family protein [Gammaproteobacteria bacterium]|nr:caspase family protein [Gammaproteobacteria bacterium]MBU1655045.1 caspase family protein [Gammaproteobacteria bacterium]MBU1961542.1 caspase family protein [Gammaproteobacteria bacterium]
MSMVRYFLVFALIGISASMPVIASAQTAQAEGGEADICRLAVKRTSESDRQAQAALQGILRGKQTEDEKKNVLWENARQLRISQPELFGKAGGVLVQVVVPGGQGEKVGLWPGDILVGYAGQPLHSNEHLIELTGKTGVKEDVFLCYLRNGLMHGVGIKGGKIGVAIVSLVPVNKEPPKEPILRLETGMHTGQIKRIGVAGAGRFLVTASLDKTLRLWSLEDGRLLQTLRPPIGAGDEGKLYATAISPDGRWIAAGGWTGKEWDNDGQIYLFDRASGELRRRLTGLPNVINHLCFSADGHRLAAGLGGKNGIRVWETQSGRETGADSDYGDQSYWCQFDGAGRLLTSSIDGHLRLYDADLKLIAKRKAPGGERPFAAVFSPDGTRIAVGFDDSTAVAVLSGRDLRPLFQPDTQGIDIGNLSRVAWSADGRRLFAGGMFTGGRFYKDGNRPVVVWGQGGRGPRSLWPAANNTIMDLRPLPDGGLLVGAADPAWLRFDRDGKLQGQQRAVIADLRKKLDKNFLLSADGRQVRFGLGFGGKEPLLFDLAQRQLSEAQTLPAGLHPPRLKAKGLKVSGWKNADSPQLNGQALALKQYETSRALAVATDGKSLLLGTEWFLRRFDRKGRLEWKIPVLNPAWGVNLSQDGRLAVAAFGDGTIRWYRYSDGQELLALFVHKETKEWILWTPEGYYDASPGADRLVGWHLNQGKDKAARFFPFNQFYDVFYRPDIVQAKFRGEEIAGLITLTAAEALKNPPPTPRFTQAPSSSRSDKERICYEIASTGGGIGEVRLFQNGKLIKSDGFYREATARKADDKLQLASLDGTAIYRALRGLQRTEMSQAAVTARDKGDSFEECLEVETLPGENEIGLAAFNATNSVQSSLETIRFQADRKPEEPHLYVLGIGIDHYRDPGISLQYAAKDANDFQALIRDKAQGLFKPEHIHIQGLSDAQASKEGIQQAIQALSTQIKPWDSFILFVASHGVLLENQYYIVTAGFDGKLEPGSLISSNEIVELSKGIKALSQLLVFDTCHAGGVDNIVSGLYDARMSVLAKKMGLHIYASAGSVQEALDGYQGNGLFTHSLLKGMNEAVKTDSNQDNQVGVIELGQRARQETTAISKTLGHPQTPYIINFGRDNPLFRVQ